MKSKPFEVFSEYRTAADFKAGLGQRGMYEQNRINERFYIGDQWYGAKCGNDRPLVRHNVIKRIGEYKMSQILSNPLSVNFSAEGVPTDLNGTNNRENEEINAVMSLLGDYYDVTAERVGLNQLYERVLRNAYVTGTSVIYTYWDSEIGTGLFADEEKTIPIKGDLACEVLDIENVFFADPYITEVQKQPYIIISSCRETDEVIREARRNGGDSATLRAIEDGSSDGKITVLTKLYKEYKADGSYTIKSVKVTENAVVRKDFDTGLRLYPLAVFSWEHYNGIIYGESEITYLIPNQIAINRMITANVWSAMTSGMPMLVVNGDTVPEGITNEPGQIIKVFGTNEEVAGAVKYIAPPDFSKNFDSSVQSLIENTLTQSGANEVALGDSRPDNATALMTMRDAAVMPLQIIKNRFYSFAEEISRIWADFWIACYGNRKIKILSDKGIRYLPFDAELLKGLIINAKIEVGAGTVYSERECTNTLITLYEKGIIDRMQLLERLPDGTVPNKKGLINDIKEEETDDGV
ncbi:MAG: hypothetical protein UHO61_02110 [Acutalibacteraceae bacterium]|nr:hypothetical protein [Acutalibacteraceae bacterium]